MVSIRVSSRQVACCVCRFRRGDKVMQFQDIVMAWITWESVSSTAAEGFLKCECIRFSRGVRLVSNSLNGLVVIVGVLPPLIRGLMIGYSQYGGGSEWNSIRMNLPRLWEREIEREQQVQQETAGKLLLQTLVEALKQRIRFDGIVVAHPRDFNAINKGHRKISDGDSTARSMDQ